MDVDGRAEIAARDLRNRNFLLLLESLRSRDTTSRALLADEVGLSVPSVHRLMADLASMGWVEPTTRRPAAARQGRPTTWFRFRDERALLAGIDVGSETTRLALGTLGGSFTTMHEIATVDLQDDLGAGLAETIQRLRGPLTGSPPLAGVAVGVPAVVDVDGVLVRPWLKQEWTGLPLRHELEGLLGCTVTVAQDNHFSALAETSRSGTAHGARSVLVVELGIGIGMGMALDGNLLSGSHGGLGRLMGWPCQPPRGGTALGATLGELITADGLLRQYVWRGGSSPLSGGADLLEASRNGDRTATSVVRWAARELSAVLVRLSLAVDPDVIVIGGGLGRGLHHEGLVPDLAASSYRPAVPVLPSVLRAESVVTGALLAARDQIGGWIAAEIQADAN